MNFFVDYEYVREANKNQYDMLNVHATT